MIRRLAILSVHTSPLAPLGGKKTGGMNVYIRELTQELGRRGMMVDIFTRRSAPNMPEVDMSLGENVRVIHLNAGPTQPMDPNELYPYLSQFASGIIAFTTRQQIQYDLVYSHYWLSGWVAYKLNEVWSIPFVQMFHTLGHMKNRIDRSQPMLPDLRVTTETQIMNWAERIVVDPRKISIVPPGVDLTRFNPLPQAEARSRLNLPPDQQLLLFVGRIEPLKAVDTILQAIDVIRQHDPQRLQNVSLAIVGGDPDNPNDAELSRLRALSQRLDLNAIVNFLGAKDHQLLPLYYSAATTLIMPSDYESFGMVALEAMASGTPVIASAVGGLAHLVKDGETGFLVPVRDPVALAERIGVLLRDNQLRAQLGANAVNLAQRYSWSYIADRLLPILEDAKARRRPEFASIS
jgi:D-inositol-3-phosphate glycosyltransferase